MGNIDHPHSTATGKRSKTGAAAKMLETRIQRLTVWLAGAHSLPRLLELHVLVDCLQTLVDGTGRITAQDIKTLKLH